MFIEEYSPELRYVKGEENIVADALTRLEVINPPMEEKHFTKEIMSQLYCYSNPKSKSKKKTKKQKQEEQVTAFPLTYLEMGQAQSGDMKLLQMVKDKPKEYLFKQFHSAGKTFELICLNDKIVIAKSQQQHIVEWYHTFLLHPGINRTEETIAQHLWWPNMRNHITNFVLTCESCQRNKRR